MAARRDQDARRHAEKKKLVETAQEINVEIELGVRRLAELAGANAFTRQAALWRDRAQIAVETREALALWDTALLWVKAVESLGRSAGVLEELAVSTGEVIARIAARGDRIDRIQ